MIVRNVVLAACLFAGPALIGSAAASEMTPEEARRFVVGKVFSFSCFDGTVGAGRIMNDGSVVGSIQFSGQGGTKRVALPANTLRVKGRAVCASLRGLSFEPCFNLLKTTDRSFRGSVSGLNFAYCDFIRHGSPRARFARAAAPAAAQPSAQ